MTRWIGAAALALTLTFGGALGIGRAAAAPEPGAIQQPQEATAADISARRRIRHHRHDAYRRYDGPYYPTYYDRPIYYAPAPFFPFLGLGYGPW